jgi:hypothetical protein
MRCWHLKAVDPFDVYNVSNAFKKILLFNCSSSFNSTSRNDKSVVAPHAALFADFKSAGFDSVLQNTSALLRFKLHFSLLFSVLVNNLFCFSLAQ